MKIDDKIREKKFLILLKMIYFKRKLWNTMEVKNLQQPHQKHRLENLPKVQVLEY